VSSESVEEVGGSDRHLAIIKLGEGDPRMGVDEGLLVDASDALERADVEDVLTPAIAGAFGDEFAVRLLVGLGPFEGRDLGFGQNEPRLKPSWPRAP